MTNIRKAAGREKMVKLAQVATARQAQLQDGRRLGFAEYGDPAGSPVMLFHDLWGNRTLRHPDDSILTRLGIRLIGMDRPGFGLSTRKPGRSFMDVVDDTMLLAKALKIDRFAVLGYSAGGPYALACACRFPQIITRCAVVCSLPPMDNPQGFQAINPYYSRLFQLAGGTESLFRLLMRGFFWIDSQREAAQYIREFAAAMPKADQQILQNLGVQSLRRDMWDEIRRSGSDAFVDEMVTLVKSWGFHLQSIQIPVDIWWGESDAFSAPMVGKRMQNFIPNASLRLEPQTGHLILFSHWQAILETLTARP